VLGLIGSGQAALRSSGGSTGAGKRGFAKALPTPVVAESKQHALAHHVGEGEPEIKREMPETRVCLTVKTEAHHS
jgi:hypothetical protein